MHTENRNAIGNDGEEAVGCGKPFGFSERIGWDFMEENLEFENGLFNLVDEDGNESAFELLGSVEIDDVTYVALVPGENEDDEYVLLKVTTDDDGCELLVTIDDDDEFDRAVAAFEEEFECEIDLDDEDEDDD